jgi:GNAT superfamily N-acetyltransferase
MRQTYDRYEIDDARNRFDLATVRGWLAGTYWWGRDAETAPQQIERAFAHSATWVGSYSGGEQLGCCRVVSDLTRFAWLADVFVRPDHRRKGLARAMVRFVLDHPDYATITRFMLATWDAHDVYAPLGFTPLSKPELLMERRRLTHDR